MQGVYVERLDHMGIVAGLCREIGLAEYLDVQAGPSQQQVSVGTATVAMILNGLGFSNRRLYLVSQFFATKPVEHLLGADITAEMLHHDCLGRTLDWLYDHDPMILFAGIARQARQRFGFPARQVHVDTTSFSVSGEYAADLDAPTLAVTYGYSRDHRADLKQWMLALATTRAGDVPLFCQALDGNASDKVTLVAAVQGPLARASSWRMSTKATRASSLRRTPPRTAFDSRSSHCPRPNAAVCCCPAALVVARDARLGLALPPASARLCTPAEGVGRRALRGLCLPHAPSVAPCRARP